MSEIMQIKAADLKPGDDLRLRFMGGEEFISITEVLEEGALIRWKGWNPVTGAMEDAVERLQDMSVRRG